MEPLGEKGSNKFHGDFPALLILLSHTLEIV